jgi:hypothetical protein
MSAVLKEQGDQFEEDWRFVFAKMGRVKPGLEQRRPSDAAIRRSLLGAIRRKPQVMVKITGFSKSAKHLAAHLDYISRQGENDVFDHQGTAFAEIGRRTGQSPHDAMHAYGRALAQDVPDASDEAGPRKRGRPRARKAMHLMLSMPPGTDTGAFELAVRDFLNEQFQAHDRLLVFHDDRNHYHAHVVIGLQGQDGRWLNPRKNDLLAWRETFAASLERHGIEAQATPAYSRGKGKDGYRRDLEELRRRGTRQRPNPSPTFDAEIEEHAIRRRAEAWTRIAEHYAAMGDQEAADAIRDYVADHYDYRPHEDEAQPRPVATQTPTETSAQSTRPRRRRPRDDGRER